MGHLVPGERGNTRRLMQFHVSDSLEGFGSGNGSLQLL